MSRDAMFLYAVLALLLVVWLRRRSKSTKYPPSPPADPIIGHLRSMPASYQHLTFAEWGKKYGGIIYAKIFHKSFVVINTLAVAKELFDVRGANYSDRPRFALYGELMGFSERLFLLRYGARWRGQRRLLQQNFNSRSVSRFRSIHQSSISILFRDLMEERYDVHHAIERSVISTIVMIAYGYHLSPGDDELVTLIETMTRKAVEYGTAGTTLVDVIPPLKYLPEWFPGAGFRAYSREVYELLCKTEDLPFETAVQKARSGDPDALRSVAWNLVCLKDKLGMDNPLYEEDIKIVCMAIFVAGVETTNTALITFLLAMVRNQDTLRKAQEEIENVVGCDRLPTHDDRKNLPFVSAIVKEVLRWNPPVPLGLPHATIDDDYYNDYFIPGGTMVLTNIWSMMHDENLGRTHDFVPERFLDTNRLLTTADTTAPVFGFGRRICPGRFFADDTLWLTIACLISVFDIRPALDSHGKQIIPEAIFKSGTTARPEDFPCRMTPRHVKAEVLIYKNLPSESAGRAVV